MRVWTWLCPVALALLPASLLAADLPGSKDPPFLKRYEGSEIVAYKTLSFNDYAMSRAGNFDKTEKVEGAVTRIVYRVPIGHTGLEIVRNYQHALEEAGFSQTYEYEQLDDYWVKTFLNPFVAQLGETDAPFWLCQTVRYLTAKATRDNQDLTAAMLVCESKNGGAWTRADSKDPIEFKPGAIMVWLDMVVAKAVEIKMVEVKAADMADALATKGAIDLYGIYFDVDKTDVKPESAKTLDEMASLLKIDRSLKLEIAGHTDSTGDKEHNMKLSQDRASAVVDALVTKYGIDPARLKANGYGDGKPVATNDTEEGRAKNRRVELKKL